MSPAHEHRLLHLSSTLSCEPWVLPPPANLSSPHDPRTYTNGGGNGSERARSQGFGGNGGGGYRLSIARDEGGHTGHATVCVGLSVCVRARVVKQPEQLDGDAQLGAGTQPPSHESPATPTDARRRRRQRLYAAATATTATTAAATTPLCSGVKFTGRAGRPIRG